MAECIDFDLFNLDRDPNSLLLEFCRFFFALDGTYCIGGLISF